MCRTSTLLHLVHSQVCCSHLPATTTRCCPADHWAVPGHASDAARHEISNPANRCPADHRAVLYWAAALYGVGNALRSAALVAYALDVLPPASRGVGIGLLRCAGDLGARCLLPSILILCSEGVSSSPLYYRHALCAADAGPLCDRHW